MFHFLKKSTIKITREGEVKAEAEGWDRFMKVDRTWNRFVGWVRQNGRKAMEAAYKTNLVLGSLHIMAWLIAATGMALNGSWFVVALCLFVAYHAANLHTKIAFRFIWRETAKQNFTRPQQNQPQANQPQVQQQGQKPQGNGQQPQHQGQKPQFQQQQGQKPQQPQHGKQPQGGQPVKQ